MLNLYRNISIVFLTFFLNIQSQDIEQVNITTDINYPPDSLIAISEELGGKVLRSYFDINKDGFKDSLIIEKSSGSGMSSTNCIFKNGISQEIFKVEYGGYYSNIRGTIVIPKVLNKQENREFLKIAKFVLLGEVFWAADQSLQWILDGLNGKYALPKNKCFSEIYIIKTKWYDSLVFPSTYSIKLNPKELKKYYREVEGTNIEDISDCSGWMTYYGHNHYRNQNGDSLTTMYCSKKYVIYRTSHGVVVKKKNKYCWAFVTDSELTGSPYKLRWESIKDVTIMGNLIIVVQSNPTTFRDQLFIIDLEKDICGNVYFSDEFEDYIELKNNKVIITGVEGENKRTITLEKHVLELSVLSKKYSSHNH